LCDHGVSWRAHLGFISCGVQTSLVAESESTAARFWPIHLSISIPE
jgi:hypothetical protein